MMKDAGRFRGKAVVLLDDAEQLRWVRGIQIKVGKKFFTLFFSMQTQLQSEFPLGFFVLHARWVVGVARSASCSPELVGIFGLTVNRV